MPQFEYLQSRAGDIVGPSSVKSVPDPYKWLEYDTQETQQWQATQAKLADNYVRKWPYYDALKKSVDYFSVGHGDLPRFVNGQWFRTGVDKITNRSGIIISESPYGDGRLLFALNDQNPESQEVLIWVSPSPDGCLLAVGVCVDGSENNTIRLIKVSTGELLPNAPRQLLMDGLSGGVNWLPDSSGFYFQALTGDAKDYKRQILFHHIADGEQTPVDIPLPDDRSSEYILITVSDDGRYHLAHRGFPALQPVAILDTEQANSNWQPFITDVEGSVVAHIIEDQLIAFTDVNAPRGRVVAIPLSTGTPNDPSSWLEVVPESEAVIRTVRPVGQYLYITEIIDTYSQVRIVDITGKSLGYIPLPGKGAVIEPHSHMATLIPKGHPDEYLFVFSTFTESWGVYRHCLSENSLKILRAPEIKIENAIVEDHWATSSDGTRIPYHTVRLVSTEITTPQPTLMYAYGGYNVPLLPTFPGPMAAFIAAGGIYVHAHLRGGGEFGTTWWQGGRMENKQNCYQDVYAIAEDLINAERTTPELLAINGRSNGGLMAGVVLTQRPELWKVVVPQVPLLDLMGGLQHPYGRDAIGIEFANLNNAEDIKRMMAFSPYHLITDGNRYPAVFLEAGATDPRCTPWHVRKFGAHLQAANVADTPVLVRIWENSGHGQATPKEILNLQYTAWLAFVMQQLGMRV